MTYLRRIFLLCVALAPLSVLAADPTPPTGVLTRDPQALEDIQAEYSPEAQAEGVQGDVVLEIDISDKGEVIAAKVTQSLGHGLDEAAIAAAQRLKFSPAEIDGKPAAVRIEYRFHFEMRPVEPVAAPDEAKPKPVVNFRGRVVERGNKTPLVGATVDVGDGAFTAFTDSDGRFELAGIPLGKAKVVVIETAHSRFETSEIIEKGKAVEVTYYLRRAKQGLFETVVIGEKEKKDVSTVKISVGEITRIPGVSGDTVKVIQNLPGAARTSFGSGEIVLRGGSTNDSIVYVDGLEVPRIFHFGGLTSIYSSELTREVEYEPGNFGVRYGRATAGRVEIKTRDPHPTQLHLVLDVNLYHATLMAEGPITDELSAAIAVRRSYVDSVMDLVYSAADDEPKFTNAPRYYDYQGKITWTPRKNDTIRLNIFGSDDKMAMVGMKEETDGEFDSLSLKTMFIRASLDWEHKFGPSTKMNLKLTQGYDRTDFDLANHVRENDKYWITGLRAEVFHELGDWLTLGAGFDGKFENLNLDIKTPKIPKANEVFNPIDDVTVSLNHTFRNWAPGVWMEAVIKPTEGLRLIPGVRLDHGSTYKQTWVDPRFTARWTIKEGTTVKGGAGIYHQFPQGAYITEEYGNPDLKEEGSRQYSVGMEQKIYGPLDVDFQVYYKDLFDLTEPSNKMVVRDGKTVSERYNNAGTGKAYGAEFMLRYNADGRFFGWLAYTYSKTKRDANNVGGRLESTGDEYDQPHNLTMVGTLELPEIWDGLSTGFRLRYGSGNPYRSVENAVYDVDSGKYSQITSETMDSRLPDFFQLDLRVEKKWTFKVWSLSSYIDVQNVTNRENASDIFYNFDYSKSDYMSDLPLFPSFGLRFEY